MLPEEQAENSRYFYELASARFGWTLRRAERRCRRSTSRAGRARRPAPAATCPATRSTGRIAEVRGLPEGHARRLAADVPRLARRRRLPPLRRRGARAQSGGIPIGFKLSAQHIEADIDAALEIGVDYVILDGRGGGTGAAPLLFRDNISVPTIPALARARRAPRPARVGATSRLIVTGGLRDAPDFAKALALGADARRDRQLARSRRSAASACARATPTTARSASPPRSRTCGPGCRSTKRRSGSTASCARRSS